MADHHTSRPRCNCLAAMLTMVLTIAASTGSPAQTPTTSTLTQPTTQLDEARQTLDRQAAVFIENRGQWDPRAKFLLRSPGLDLWITSNGVVYDIHRIESAPKNNGPRIVDAASIEKSGADLEPDVMKVTRTPVFITYEGSGDNASAIGSGRLQQYHNYYIGTDRSKWAERVPLYSGAQVQGLYKGIDAVFYLDGGRPRYDLVVAPGADPSGIRMKVEGATDVTVSAAGALQIRTTLGTVEQRELFAYQQIDGKKKQVRCAFVAESNGRVSFSVGRYDRSRPLVIDPLVYSTYLGGSSNDFGHGIAVDGSGNAYVTGYTQSTNFPTLNASQSSNAGGNDAFVTKLTSSGAVSYSTYLGGSSSDIGAGIAVDGSGNAYICGNTASTNFPTLNAAQSSNGGGANDAFVTKLTSSGAISYSTYLGGTGDELAREVAVDGSGNAYTTGYTTSTNFPTLNAAQSSMGGVLDAFVTKLTSSGALSYSTYLGGSNDDRGLHFAVDGSGNAYVTGLVKSTNFPTLNAAQSSNGGGVNDAFVTKLTSSGVIAYSTYLGGSGDDAGAGIAIDGSGNAYVTGFTRSSNFPTLNAAQASHGGDYDVFVTKLTSSGAIAYSTYLGGSSGDATPLGIAIDGSGNAYICGNTASTNFPTLNAAQTSNSGGTQDAFVTKLTSSGALSYSTYLGGSGDDVGAGIAIDGSGNAYVRGSTSSTNYPTFNATQSSNAGGVDVFVTKLTSSGALSYSTYLGGSGDDVGAGIAIDGSGNAYISGSTQSANFPTLNAAQGNIAGNSDAFVSKLLCCASISSVSLGGSSPYCAGSTVTIGWTSTGVNSVDIDLSTDNGSTWSSIATSQSSGTNGGSYSWTVPSSAGADRKIRVRDASTTSINAASSSFAIDSPPAVTTHPATNSLVCPGTSVAFSAAASGTPAPAVLWERSTDGGSTFSSLPGETSSTLTISSPTLSMNGYHYRASFTNSCSTVTSNAATLQVGDAVDPTITAPDDITVNADPGSCAATGVDLGTPTTGDNCVVASVVNDAPASFPEGATTVTWTVTDGVGNTATATQMVTVLGNEAPTLTLASNAVLWPPNHAYETFSVSSIVSGVSGNCSSSLTASDAEIWKVTSDEVEDANGNGDGNTSNDIVIASDCKSVQLRAEREGNGNGRVYRVYVRVTDDNGNTSSSSTYYTVSVPHSQDGDAAVDDDVVNYEQSCGSAKPVTGDATLGYLLMQNHPNPFSGSTRIEYTVPTESLVSLMVYDAQGGVVATIVDAEQRAGTHAVEFDGSKLASGTYAYVLRSNGAVLARTMVLVR